MEKIIHPIPPVYDGQSKVLVLGSFPSVKSREQKFFYGNPQNRFWKVLSAVFNDEVPLSVEQKKAFLLKNKVAVYDVIYSCEISGSSDSSIKSVVPADLTEIIANGKIKTVYLNGKTAGKLYEKYLSESIGLNYAVLPSTSPANAAYTFDKLLKEWKIIAGI